MGKIHREWNKDLNDWVTWDEDVDVVEVTPKRAVNILKSGMYDLKEVYETFCQHPEYIKDEFIDFFRELEEEFGEEIHILLSFTHN